MGIYAFASHKGGVGKTTLVFHAACQKAHTNPGQTVLVIDMTKMGDTSKMLLGSRDKLVDVAGMDASEKSATAFLEHLESLSVTTPVKGPKPRGGPASGSTPTLFDKLFSTGRSAVVPDPAEAGPSTTGMWRQYAVQVSTHNANVPKNLYLVAGGPLPTTLKMFKAAEQATISTLLRNDVSADNLTVIFDTDGDLPTIPRESEAGSMTSHPYTKIALQTAQGVLVPAKPSTDDVDRVASFCKELTEMRFEFPVTGAHVSRFQTLIWNDVDLYKWEPTNNFPFTPPSTAQEIVTALTTLVYNTAVAYPDSFYQPATQGAPDSFQSFTKNATLAVPRIANGILTAAFNLRIPFCKLRAGNHKADNLGRVTFKITQEDIDRHVRVIQQIVDVLV